MATKYLHFNVGMPQNFTKSLSRKCGKFFRMQRTKGERTHLSTVLWAICANSNKQKCQIFEWLRWKRVDNWSTNNRQPFLCIIEACCTCTKHACLIEQAASVNFSQLISTFSRMLKPGAYLLYLINSEWEEWRETPYLVPSTTFSRLPRCHIALLGIDWDLTRLNLNLSFWYFSQMQRGLWSYKRTCNKNYTFSQFVILSISIVWGIFTLAKTALLS